jgi:putative transcriptional regulator
MPGLAGSYFGDTLTFVCEHNADGAMGLIVNRPSPVTVIELMAQLGIDKGRTPVDRLVMEGGPVGGERGFILHSEDSRFEGSLSLGSGIMLSSAREVLEAIADSKGPESYLVALGYLRERNPRRVVFAAPVCSRDGAEALRTVADEVVCLECPPDMRAVGWWYEDFTPTTDAEVADCLHRTEARGVPA